MVRAIENGGEPVRADENMAEMMKTWWKGDAREQIHTQLQLEI